MKDQVKKLAKATADIEDAANAGLVAQLSMMMRALWASPVRNRLLFLCGAIFLDIVSTAFGQIRLNSWNEPFYDALSRRDLGSFMTQLLIFGAIAGGLLVLNVVQTWLNQRMKVTLRDGLVRDLVGQWLKPRRAFRLANAGAIGVNPDQRLHEDARHLTELSTDLGIGLLQASILLVTFVSVLWGLSAGFSFVIGGHSIVIPGYMVWAAVLYAGSASLLSYWVGRPLINRNSERYAREADLRFSMMRVNEHIDAIALAGGEADEARRIKLDLDTVLTAMGRLVASLTNLTWVTAGYGWFTLVAPILVATPVYFSGNLSFGGLMMAVGAFNQVQTSLRWFVDNFSVIADWRATLVRVASFRRAVLMTDILEDAGSRIEIAPGPPGKITIERLEIASPSGSTMLRETKVEIKAGERVLIVGDRGTGKTLLFRALAGLWPWGAGRIVHPRGEEIMYLPRTPYLPPGTLREVLAYPLKVDTFHDDDFTDALVRTGLERLAGQLDANKRWDRDLNEDEQQALAFARLKIHNPPWALIDEVLDTVEEDTRDRMLDILSHELKNMGAIHIGRPETHDHVFSRVIHLVMDTMVTEPDIRQSRPPAAATRALDVSRLVKQDS